MPLSEGDRRRFRQRMQRATDKQFWDAQNVMHNDAFAAGVKLVLDTMWLHPKISKTMVEWVKERSVGVREDWNQMHYVEIEDSIMTLITGREAICPNCQKKSSESSGD